ncbi:MAG TPA: transcription-repair coupling factor [Clostridiaceae bacterium]|nr:transcription-repair coupling factor [Clostridiaceae bacterium]
MEEFLKPLSELDEFDNILSSIRDQTGPVVITGPSDSQKVHFAWALACKLNSRVLYLAYNEHQAAKVFDDFAFFIGDKAVHFPSREIILHNIEARSYDDVYARINTLDRIINGECSVVVTSAEALLNRLPDRNFFRESIIEICVGSRLDISEALKKFSEMGYERVNAVEGKGQFAVRGGIIDIFSPGSDFAARLELFGDEVDSIRFFDVLTQRSVSNCEKLRLIPAREVLFRAEGRHDIVKSVKKDLQEFLKAVKDKETSKRIYERVQEDMESLENDHYFPGVDRYIPYILNNFSTLPDYLGKDTVVFIDEPLRFRERIENAKLEHDEAVKILLEKGSILPSAFNILMDYEETENMLSQSRLVELATMAGGSGKKRTYHIQSKSLSTYRGHLDLLVEDIKRWKKSSYRMIILSGTSFRGSKLADNLREKNIEAAFYKKPNDLPSLPENTVTVTSGSLNTGFEYPAIKFIVISDREVFGQERRAVKRPAKNKGDRIKSFTDLKPGDFVVHQVHGIGQYEGIEKLVVENIKKDYLKIRYLQGDYLYIPTNQLDLIQKFIGAEGKAPKLNKLGGSDWNKQKKKVKESLKEIAEELIKIYAQRQATKGHAFSGDTIWQMQFEELFPYEETEDQIRCIEEVKRDMESDKLMDRLLCGDVGYGKTEVAIRAAFKAVMDGKQVAYLVPTTILAQQHYNTFKERMKDFPVTVEVLSRFRSKGEQEKIIRNIKAGMVDIIIGTHRLIQKDVKFKDLGLLIIDEEQRFGVEHKEKIKKLRPNVDVLTLTATPIPRTLHMALAGIRDISTLEDPPEERYPVQTFVMEYDPDVIRDAIMREMGRRGQVFYLFNRVRSIHLKAAEIASLVPDARIGVAHGQMDERELENVMFNFINGEYDVLVCTTIIEAGLDMPNVNTIIVENADKMGLAQLYQLRGRVGRSNRLAYAYITYKKDKVLSEIAEKRLNAIKEFTEFGSGFKIAMRDLEIRGAGNLLGPEQSGHIASVGYDMYCKLLNEAVMELKGEMPSRREREITIDLNVDAYIEDDYIEDEIWKIDMYKRIAAIQDEKDEADVKDELIDRYGDIPLPVSNLIAIALIKVLASDIGIIAISQKSNNIIFQFGKDKKINIEGISNLVAAHKRKLMFNAGNNPYFTYRITDEDGGGKLLDNIKILLHDAKNFAV